MCHSLISEVNLEFCSLRRPKMTCWKMIIPVHIADNGADEARVGGNDKKTSNNLPEL